MTSNRELVKAGKVPLRVIGSWNVDLITYGPARHPSGVRRGVAVQSPRDKKDSTAPVCRLGGGRRVPPDRPGGHAPGRQARAAKSRSSHSPVPFLITIHYYHHLNPFPNHPDPPDTTNHKQPTNTCLPKIAKLRNWKSDPWGCGQFLVIMEKCLQAPVLLAYRALARDG